MEKKVIIDFLNEHWDELEGVLSETVDSSVGLTLTEHFPDDLCKFVNLLSKLISTYRIQAADEKSQSPVYGDHTFYSSLNSAIIFDSYHTEKGLLEKARQFRKDASLHTEEEDSSIIIKNGLFTVQPQQYNEALNTSFKTLVDSVL